MGAPKVKLAVGDYVTITKNAWVCIDATCNCGARPGLLMQVLSVRKYGVDLRRVDLNTNIDSMEPQYLKFVCKENELTSLQRLVFNV